MPTSEDRECPCCMVEGKTSLDAFALGLLFGSSMKDTTALLALSCGEHRVDLSGAMVLADIEARRYAGGMACWEPEVEDDELG